MTHRYFQRKIFFWTLVFLFVCSYVRAQGNGKPIPVILDTDMGPDYDDVGALTLLHAFADSGKATILATIASNRYEGIAAVLNLFNTYFHRPGIPIGVPKGYAVDRRDSQHWTDSILAKYPHRIRSNSEAADAVGLYREILAAQPDHSVVLISVGFFTNLSNLLQSQPDQYSSLTGSELVRRKVQRLVSMAGAFPEGKEFNIYNDIGACRYVVDHWPTAILFSGFEIGKKIKCGLPLSRDSSIHNSPVKDVFRICIPLAAEDSDGRSSWDETAVLAGILGNAPYFTLRPGRMQLQADGTNIWTGGRTDGQAYLVRARGIPEIQQLLNRLLRHQPVSSRDSGRVDSRSVIERFVKQQVSVRSISQVVLSPDGKNVAWNADGPEGSQVIYRASLTEPERAIRVTADAGKQWCNETEPQWSPDGKQIAFLSDCQTPGQPQLFVVDAEASPGKPLPAASRLRPKAGFPHPRPLTRFAGYVSHLHWSPDGQCLSVLYVDKASREPSPMAAENKLTGIIDSLVNRDIQRIAVVRISHDSFPGTTRQITPPGLYIFEYAWSPDCRTMAYTAAPPPGDDNWYIAALYRQAISDTSAVRIYQPTWQIALPQWSPDGTQISFIEGLMSDQGGTGGEIFTMAASGNEKPTNLTPDRKSTPAWYTWSADGNILFSEFAGGSTNICRLRPATGGIEKLWSEQRSIQASSAERSFAIARVPDDSGFEGSSDSTRIAFVRTGWSELPEIWAGTLRHQRPLTHLNRNIDLPMPAAASVEWTNEGQTVQGWLLYPADFDFSRKYPLLVTVHGGPAWIATPTWSLPDFNATVYTRLGYFVFLPNARGSYGQGEQFTLRNRRDWGHGDLRDMLAGIDHLLEHYPIDSTRMGMMGWSYGGYTSMFTITQTNRFRAVVAGAGAGDWLSYYGQNAIDKWMKSYFGASPYDDPEGYAYVSAMTYIKQAKTPALLLVGELDGEAPPAQSLQYWHALKELGIPTQLVIYPEEGHSFFKLEDTIDVTLRAIQWFDHYLVSGSISSQ